MEDRIKEISDEMLEDVTGGTGNDELLEKYLKELEKSNKDTMVDKGPESGLDLNPAVNYDKSENLIIVKREKGSELPTGELQT